LKYEWDSLSPKMGLVATFRDLIFSAVRLPGSSALGLHVRPRAIMNSIGRRDTKVMTDKGATQ
jgi:hypothetical protein